MTTAQPKESAAKKDVQKLQRAIIDGLEDVKAQDIQVFDTEHLSPLFERVIVASGTSNRQTKALAASVRDAVREAGFAKPRVEGEDNGEWIIVDCGAAVAHIMQPAIRQYYHLEEIWGDTPVRLKLGSAKPAVKVAMPVVAKAAAKSSSPATKKAAAKPGARKTKPVKPEPVFAPERPVLSSPAKKVAAKTSPSALPKTKPSTKTVAKTPAKKAATKVATKTPVSVKTIKVGKLVATVKKAAAKTPVRIRKT